MHTYNEAEQSNNCPLSNRSTWRVHSAANDSRPFVHRDRRFYYCYPLLLPLLLLLLLVDHHLKCVRRVCISHVETTAPARETAAKSPPIDLRASESKMITYTPSHHHPTNHHYMFTIVWYTQIFKDFLSLSIFLSLFHFVISFLFFFFLADSLFWICYVVASTRSAIRSDEGNCNAVLCQGWTKARKFQICP